MRLVPNQPGYPPQLLELPYPPTLDVSGPLDGATKRVAIVGARSAIPGSTDFARKLARTLVNAGAVVVSGGATGVDAAAHEGALDAEGATWVVAPSGRDLVFPEKHAALFARVEQAPRSRMIWPFPEGVGGERVHLRFRNGVLVALSDAVVIVQARLQSGSRNAAAWARGLGRPVWVVPAPPWMANFAGSMHELELGARVLNRLGPFFATIGLRPPTKDQAEQKVGDGRRVEERSLDRSAAARPLLTPPSFEGWTEDEKSIFSSLSGSPTHSDLIADDAHLSAARTSTALLTLALKNVVVEGPDGFFRRRANG